MRDFVTAFVRDFVTAFVGDFVTAFVTVFVMAFVMTTEGTFFWSIMSSTVGGRPGSSEVTS